VVYEITLLSVYSRLNFWAYEITLLSMCLCVPLTVARQQAVCVSVRPPLFFSFSMRSVSYQRN
jgi:hypothetical protein